MKVLIVEYDVTGMSEDEVSHLCMEAVVQGEPSDDHPNARTTWRVEDRSDPPATLRKIAIRVNESDEATDEWTRFDFESYCAAE